MSSKGGTDDFFSSFNGGAADRGTPGSSRRPIPPPPPPLISSKPQTTRPSSDPSINNKSYYGASNISSTNGASSSIQKQNGTSASSASAAMAMPTPTPTPTPTATSKSGAYYGTPQPTQTTQPPSYYGVPTPTPAPVPVPAPAPLPSHPQQQSSSWNYGPAASHQPSQTQPNVINPYMLTKPKQAPNSTGLESAMDGGKAEPSATTGSYQPNPSYAATTGFMSGTIDNSVASQFSGTMDTNAQTTTFIPQTAQTSQKSPSSIGFQPYDPNQFADEPPLLEELGINIDHILAKTRAVVLPLQRFGGNMDSTVIQDADLAGPIALALLLGGELLFTGKIHFGYIYGFGLFGCLAMTLVLNLMSPHDAISVWTVTSILGYSLLPVNILAVLKILLVNLGKLETLGRLLGVLTVFWCTVSSTRLMEQGCDMRNQRYLIAYPICLLYSAFVLITIF